MDYWDDGDRAATAQCSAYVMEIILMDARILGWDAGTSWGEEAR